MDKNLLQDANAQGIIARRHIHAHPELSGFETATSSYLKELLQDWGCAIVAIPESLSFLAWIDKGCSESIGIRAELDALPINEPIDMPYASANQGVMHACGHDVHMGIAVALAYFVSQDSSPLPYNILLVFESSEEKLPGGALAIARSETLKPFSIKYMLAMHCEPTMEIGHMGIREGEYMASGDEVYITIEGSGGHAALPHTLVDPILVAAHTLIALQSVTSRYAPPQVTSVLSFGRIENAGSMNLIPDRVRLDGTFRTHNQKWRDEAKELITRIATRIAESFGARAHVEIRSGYPPLINDEALAKQAREILWKEAAIEAVHPLDLRMTTDDFAYFQSIAPSLYMRLGVGKTGNLHSTSFCPDERAIHVGLYAFLSLIKSLE